MVVAAVLAVPGVAGAALPAGCAQSGATVSCAYSSGTNTFTVPAGISTVHVVAVGGAGGANGTGVSGGHGARAEADLSVTPGETLYAVVGGNGGKLGSFTSTAGANGGGAGGGALCSTTCVGDGGGGGASDVRTSSGDLTTRLIVAGGGGGAGRSLTGLGGSGGNAGEAGSPGAAAGELAGGPNGGAGTSDAGGVGGASPPAGGGTTGCGGANGTLGHGGAGGSVFPGGTCSNLGGGGGGGVYGGGGGAGGASSASVSAGGGGGGGGSSLVPPGGSVTLDYSDNPVVVISYTVPVTGSPSAQLAPQAAVTGDSPYTLAFTASFTPSPGATVTGVLIRWGDGTTPSSFSSPAGSSMSVSHTFASAGTYLTTMKVTDSDGQSDTDAIVVTVTTPAAPPAVPKCVVPKLARASVALAKQVLPLLACTVGATSKTHSRSVGKGLVIGTSPGAGSYAAGEVIALKVSSGPPPKRHKKKK